MGWETLAIGAMSAIGSMGGGGGGGGGGEVPQIDPAMVAEYEQKAQGYLDTALRNAIPYSEYFTQKAMEELNSNFAQARIDLNKGWEMGQAQTAPYREAGYQALDQYQDTLGLARPKSGSSRMYHAQENLAKENALRAQLGQQAARTAGQLGMSQDDTIKFVKAAQLGSNEFGLNRALQQYTLSGAGQPQAGLSATLAPERPGTEYGSSQEGGSGGGGSGGGGPFQQLAALANRGGGGGGGGSSPAAPYNPSNPYANLLSATSDRFNVANPAAQFSRSTTQQYMDLNNLLNSMSSSQRALAHQSANTGY